MVCSSGSWKYLYTVHRKPENLPIVIPIVLETENDFKNLEKAAQNNKRYLFAAYSYRRYNKGIFPYNLFQFNLPFVSMLLKIFINSVFISPNLLVGRV